MAEILSSSAAVYTGHVEAPLNRGVQYSPGAGPYGGLIPNWHDEV